MRFAIGNIWIAVALVLVALLSRGQRREPAVLRGGGPAAAARRRSADFRQSEPRSRLCAGLFLLLGASRRSPAALSVFMIRSCRPRGPLAPAGLPADERPDHRAARCRNRRQRASTKPRRRSIRAKSRAVRDRAAAGPSSGCWAYSTAWRGCSWDGQQVLLFDLPARKFHIFGLTLWPQDFVYLALLLIIAALSLFFFTALAGRVFCGYACPQTVWTELFLWIEQWTEGTRSQAHETGSGSVDRPKSCCARAASRSCGWLSPAIPDSHSSATSCRSARSARN